MASSPDVTSATVSRLLPIPRRRLPRRLGSNLLLAPGVQRVVHRSFETDLFVVVLALHERESVRDGVQARSLGAVVALRGEVRTINDRCKTLEGWIVEAELDHDRFEAAAAVDVSELDVLDVVRGRRFPFGRRHDLVRGYVQELCGGVDEVCGQHGT